MRGSGIIVSSHPRGRFEEIVCLNATYPGTVMQLDPTIAPIGGRFTFEAANRVDGSKGPNPVLVEDWNQGQLAITVIAAGAHAQIYWPAAGEELNMLMRYHPGTGTSTDENIGDLLEVDNTGMVTGVSSESGGTGAHVSAPFQLREHLTTALTANTLVWCQYLGDQA